MEKIAPQKRITISDTWLRVAGIGLMSANSIVNSIPSFYAKSWFAIVKHLLVSVVTIVLLWEVSRFIIIYSRKKLGTDQNNRRRLIESVALTTLSTFFILGVVIWLNEKPSAGRVHIAIISLLVSSLILACFFMGIFEAIYYFNKLNLVEKEKKELERINLQGQFDSLKGQVNPHFLFNSLNSLRQLVLKDPQKAAHYVEEMSDVYRYLLRNNDGELTALRNELGFIQSYCHLLKTRFDEGLQVQFNVPDRWLSWQLPPLTLQMLIENCVKHNIISISQPLHINVTVNEKGQLLVSNNLQKKLNSVPSEKVGLANIITKYRYLGYPDVAVTETNTEFVVSLPLIKNQLHEYTHS
ncbi:MAG: histidine kinase [Dinghuibacter sp.]|nr:histidine kinase [Dinghuibacter sp.]